MLIKNEQMEGKIKELHRKYKLKFSILENGDTIARFLNKLDEKNFQFIAVDIETSSLNFTDGDMLGIGIAWSETSGVYINTRGMSDFFIKRVIKGIQKVKAKKCYWNGYFDVSFMKGRYGETIDFDLDGLIYLHTTNTHRKLEYRTGCINKKKGFSLKEVTAEKLPYGDYEQELIEFKKKDCRERKIKDKDYSYAYIPDEVLAPYCIMDCICTWQLQKMLNEHVVRLKSTGWSKLDYVLNLKHEVTKLYIDSTVGGFKIDRKRVKSLSDEFDKERKETFKKLMLLPEIKEAEKIIFRRAVAKKQSTKRKYDENQYNINKTFREELTKRQSKRKSQLNLSDCRKIFVKVKEKLERRKKRDYMSSIVKLSECRKIKEESIFNFGSSIHKNILFGEILKLDAIEKTPTGHAKYDSSFIEYYSEKGVAFMSDLHNYNLYNKGITAFLGTDENSTAGLWNLSSDNHPYVHAFYSICGTITSRTATSSPCYSQVPSRGVLKKIKQCYVVEDDYKLICFDYSNAEMRILAEMSQEPNFVNAFNQGLDLHSFMALNVFKDKMDTPEGFDELSIKEQLDYVKNNYSDTFRYWAKSVNFGLPYGIQEKGLAKNIGTDVKQAKSILNDYMKSNNKIKSYMDENKKKAFEKGYVENVTGARMYLPACKGYNPFKNHKKKNWEAISQYRKSTNWIIQSQNAFLMYESMVNFFSKVKELGLDITLLTTIYDAVYLRVNKKYKDGDIVNLLKECYEIKFGNMPMLIDVEVSKNEDGSYSNRWYDTKGI